MTEFKECYVCGIVSSNPDDFDEIVDSGVSPHRHVCKTQYDGQYAFSVSKNGGRQFPSCHMKYDKKYRCCCCGEEGSNGYIFMESNNVHYNNICGVCYNKALGVNDVQFISDGNVLEKVQQWQNMRKK